MSIKEENLIKYEGTILPGQRLVKVGNTFMPVGVGGAFEPGSGGGGSMKFYKCASVDTSTKTWTGYELVYNEAGYYELSDVVTENLTYSGFIPVVDGIYSADCTIEVCNFYQGFLLVSPTNMTSNETDEWLISASSYCWDPYLAFDGNTTNPYNGWVSGHYTSPPQWLQWQNKIRKSKVSSYSIQAAGENSYSFTPKSWILYGSNDGSDWVVVDERTDGITSANAYEIFNFNCQNPDYYYYYRLDISDNLSGSGYTSVGQLQAIGKFE